MALVRLLSADRTCVTGRHGIATTTACAGGPLLQEVPSYQRGPGQDPRTKRAAATLEARASTRPLGRAREAVQGAPLRSGTCEVSTGRLRTEHAARTACVERQNLLLDLKLWGLDPKASSSSRGGFALRRGSPPRVLDQGFLVVRTLATHVSRPVSKLLSSYIFVHF